MDASVEVALENVVRIHSTRIIDPRSSLTLEAVAIPSAALRDRPSDLTEAAHALDLTIFGEAPDPALSFLPHALSAVLLSSEAEEAGERFRVMMDRPPVAGLDVDPAVLNFAIYCSFAEVIGVEESPLRSKVLAAIVAAGGSVAVAAMATIAAPVVVVVGASVALGAGTIIIFSTAAAVSERIYRKIAG